ncbi:hypothetical protein [Leptospira sp. GIMC2001]|uniref:hypothetical protein n=1 Tax=Leptospira sp. GIMC2001 TaxID=1513297 RepID=UPI00234B8E63|nr:hypothetical protein [Leptospira sp. GIMC2001]WCL49422.1 hypothetical protein O4O04_19355 [Leptospira sp. GIMC2001]
MTKTRLYQSQVICFILIFIISCRSKHETFLEEVNDFVNLQKYDKALQIIQDKLESKRDSDEVISITKPRRERHLRMSQDRNRIVWSEDSKLIFRDIPNPLVKTQKLPEAPYEFRIASNAEYSLVSFRLKNTKGCRMLAISMLDEEMLYESGAHIACRNSGGIAPDGKTIYYFIDENLYKEKTSNPKKPIKIIDSAKIIPPYPKLRNKFSLIPINQHFLLVTGVAGSYNVYFFNTKSETLELLTKEIVSPKAFYAHGKSVFMIGGKIGNWLLREVDYTNPGKPKINTGFSITLREVEPWKLTTKNDFLSFYNNTIFSWGPMLPRKEFPLLCERAWGVGRDHIIYENKIGELVLANMAYSEEDWKVLELYKQVKKQSNQ